MLSDISLPGTKALCDGEITSGSTLLSLLERVLEIILYKTLLYTCMVEDTTILASMFEVLAQTKGVIET